MRVLVAEDVNLPGLFVAEDVIIFVAEDVNLPAK
jgi:hypothetical protein